MERERLFLVSMQVISSGNADFFKSCSPDLNATVAKEGIKWVVPLSIKAPFWGGLFYSCSLLHSSWVCLARGNARARANVETWEGILKSCWAHNLRDSTLESFLLSLYNNKKAAEILRKCESSRKNHVEFCQLPYGGLWKRPSRSVTSLPSFSLSILSSSI